jgi:uncharacterized SAM-binding protein YcdF (DUF218 family)
MIRELATLARELPIPPLSLFLLAGLGRVVGGRKPRVGRWLVGSAALILFLLCLPIVGDPLLRSLETPSEAVLADAGDADAIIVLSADIAREAPEYGGASVGALTLVRLRYGAYLAHRFNLPLLVTGGKIGDSGPPLGPLMAAVLKDEFGVTVRWVEDRSRTTYENAKFSVPMLKADGIRSALLVTHSWHMPRSLLAFTQAGFAVRPAPTDFTPPFEGRIDEFIPSAHAFQNSAFAIHEWIGLAWYRFGSVLPG